MNKKSKVRDSVEGVLKDVIGDLRDGPTPVAPDVIGDFLHHQQYGIDPPRDANAPATKKVVQAPPLTGAEIAESLAALSKTLGRPGFKKLAKEVEEDLEESNPLRGWLTSYCKGDEEGMRGAIRKFVKVNRPEIEAHFKAGGHSAAELLLKPDDKSPN